MSRRLLLVLAPAVFLGFSIACGGDDKSPKTVSDSTPPTSTANQSVDTTTSPIVKAPASKYAVSQDDLEAGAYITDLAGTYFVTPDMYAGAKTFTSPQEGQSLLKQWGYVGGYETGYEPEGRLTAVLNGSYYITEEVHLFAAEDGAKQAYDHFEKKLKQGGVAQNVPAGPVGNSSTAWQSVQGRVGTSSVASVLHTVLFRRGNLLVVILTRGAQPFMKIDAARGLALIADQKALGLKEAIEPTPASNYKTPTLTPKSPTPAAPSAATATPAR